MISETHRNSPQARPSERTPTLTPSRAKATSDRENIQSSRGDPQPTKRRRMAVGALLNPALDASRPIPELVDVVIKDLRPGMKHLRLQFIVLDEDDSPTRTAQGEPVFHVRVADATGSIILAAFAERGAALRSGDICEVRWGYAAERDGVMQLYVGKIGLIHRVGRCVLAPGGPLLSHDLNTNYSSPGDMHWLAGFDSSLMNPTT